MLLMCQIMSASPCMTKQNAVGFQLPRSTNFEVEQVLLTLAQYQAQDRLRTAPKQPRQQFQCSSVAKTMRWTPCLRCKMCKFSHILCLGFHLRMLWGREVCTYHQAHFEFRTFGSSLQDLQVIRKWKLVDLLGDWLLGHGFDWLVCWFLEQPIDR